MVVVVVKIVALSSNRLYECSNSYTIRIAAFVMRIPPIPRMENNHPQSAASEERQLNYFRFC